MTWIKERNLYIGIKQNIKQYEINKRIIGLF